MTTVQFNLPDAKVQLSFFRCALVSLFPSFHAAPVECSLQSLYNQQKWILLSKQMNAENSALAPLVPQINTKTVKKLKPKKFHFTYSYVRLNILLLTQFHQWNCRSWALTKGLAHGVRIGKTKRCRSLAQDFRIIQSSFWRCWFELLKAEEGAQVPSCHSWGTWQIYLGGHFLGVWNRACTYKTPSPSLGLLCSCKTRPKEDPVLREHSESLLQRGSGAAWKRAKLLHRVQNTNCFL